MPCRLQEQAALQQQHDQLVAENAKLEREYQRYEKRQKLRKSMQVRTWCACCVCCVCVCVVCCVCCVCCVLRGGGGVLLGQCRLARVRQSFTCCAPCLRSMARPLPPRQHRNDAAPATGNQLNTPHPR
jgi:lipopolysaccharide/colanic/teichoic acid biosynthesis glycosyltransferase